MKCNGNFILQINKTPTKENNTATTSGLIKLGEELGFSVVEGEVVSSVEPVDSNRVVLSMVVMLELVGGTRVVIRVGLGVVEIVESNRVVLSGVVMFVVVGGMSVVVGLGGGGRMTR